MPEDVGDDDEMSAPSGRVSGFDALGRAQLMARIGATYFFTGAAVGAVINLLPDLPDDYSRGWVWLVVVLGAVGGTVQLLGAGRIPVSALHLIVPGGAIIITLAVANAGALADSLAVFYVTGTYPFTFFRWRVAAAHSVFVGLCYAVALATTHGVEAPFAHWLVVFATTVALGSAINWLLQRLEGVQAELTELNETLEDRVETALADVEASRRRIVTAGDEQRRKIERDLHDGAQQHLVALKLKMQLVAEVVDDDVGEAKELLVDARSIVQEAIDELRSLAHGIYPPLLRDGGLPAALSAAARRSPLTTRVDIGDIDRYQGDVEAAVYFCCLEALQNAAKYAGESATVEVRVYEDDAVLRFSVEDDGPGFGKAEAALGQGFLNMSDRLGALGGRLDVHPAEGGGVAVQGEIPLTKI